MKFEELKLENENLKQQLTEIQDESQNVRRSTRASLPTDKMLASLSPAALRELKKKIETTETQIIS